MNTLVSLCSMALLVVASSSYLCCCCCLVVVPTITLVSAAASNDLVSGTCHKTPNYQLCVSTLNSNPKSKTTDVSGLGLIVISAVKSKSASTLQRIHTLIKSNPELKTPLNQCAQYYNAILNADVPSANQALTRGDPKFAESGMADAANEAAYCEQVFKEDGGGKSPLTSMNKLVHDLSLIAASIARLLL